MPPDDTMRLGSLRRQVRADHLPALAAVRRLEDHLAAVVDGVVIERIDRQRRRPVTAVLELGRRRIERVNPRADRARAPRRARPSASPRCRSSSPTRCRDWSGSGSVKPDSQPPRFGSHGVGRRCRRVHRPPPPRAAASAAPVRRGPTRRRWRRSTTARSATAIRRRRSARASCRCPGGCCRSSTAPGCRRRRDTSGRSAAAICVNVLAVIGRDPHAAVVRQHRSDRRSSDRSRCRGSRRSRRRVAGRSRRRRSSDGSCCSRPALRRRSPG